MVFISVDILDLMDIAIHPYIDIGFLNYISYILSFIIQFHNRPFYDFNSHERWIDVMTSAQSTFPEYMFSDVYQ